MSNSIIEVEKLGKRYRIGARRTRSETLGGAIKQAVLEPFAYFGSRLRRATEAETFWALRDVTFAVAPGEVLGIIGRNGAGKSTLLKILSRITDPTEGQAAIRGRVNSLLEVGTGFHAELTGRENIYMNGAIHGMRKREVDRKFDEIVEFAEVERFIDTPVKHYSSGMYTRLAFGVAAHLEPDILLVDEVLAVGDMAFQKKCIGKMSSVAREGRTVLFVSHNMAAVTALCTRLILLDGGRVISEGAVQDVVDAYIQAAPGREGEVRWLRSNEAPGDDVIQLRSVRVVSGGTVSGNIPINESFDVEIEFLNLRKDVEIMSAIHLFNSNGVRVMASINAPSACISADTWFGRAHPTGVFVSRCTIPANFLNDGHYTVMPVISTEGLVRAEQADAVGFTVHETGEMRKEYRGAFPGVVRPKLRWETRYVGSSEEERE